MSAVGGAIGELLEYRLPDDYWDTYASKVQALRPADIHDAAKSLIHPEQMIWIVVGDRSKIEDGLRSLNIGEIHTLTLMESPSANRVDSASVKSAPAECCKAPKGNSR